MAGRAKKVPVAADASAPPEAPAPTMKGPRELPVLPVRHTVLFPFAILPLNVGRERSVALLNDVMAGDRTIAVLAQKDGVVEDPGFADLYETGTLGTVLRMVRFPDERYSVLVQGIERVKILHPVADQPYLKARFEGLPESSDESVETEALVKNVLEQFERVVALVPAIPDEAVSAARNQTGSGQIADFIASLLELPAEDKQKLLETLDAKERLRLLTGVLGRELQVLEVGAQIRDQVKESLDQHQREFLLRQQLEAIRRELGEGDDGQREIEELKAKLEKAQLPAEVQKEADRELSRLRTIPPQAAEYTVARTYLEWLADMPWAVLTEDDLDLKHARAVLDEDHYGLEKIKERILEYLVVRKFKADARTPILCFVGPPGTGKTSLGRSIARALGRKFVRQSLGGVRDEAEIRGHRRTYIGALPGNVIRGIRRAGSRNPLFMLDEVDKLGADFHGDPSSALLEVLDPEQNGTFTDHYLDVPFDLSQVHVHHHREHPRHRAAAAARPHGGHPALGLHRPREARDRPAPPDPQGDARERARVARAHVHRRGRAQGGARVHAARPACGTWSARSRTCCARAPRSSPRARTSPRAIGPERVRELLGPERYQNEKVQRINVPGRRARPGLDAGGRRGAHRRDRAHARHAAAHPHRPARRRHAGVRAGGAHLRALARRSARHPARLLRAQRPARAPADRRHPQGRPLGRHHAVHGDGRPAHRPQGALGPGHDRRDHAAGPGAEDRRTQGEGARARTAPGSRP